MSLLMKGTSHNQMPARYSNYQMINSHNPRASRDQDRLLTVRGLGSGG